MPAADVGRALKSQIVVLHTGELPGKPVMVQKDSGVQTMIDEELEKTVKSLFAEQESMEYCRPTPLTLRGREVWQDENRTCCLFMGKRHMILDCDLSAAFIIGSVSKEEERDRLEEHLSRYDWTGGAEGHDGPGNQEAGRSEEQAGGRNRGGAQSGDVGQAPREEAKTSAAGQVVKLDYMAEKRMPGETDEWVTLRVGGGYPLYVNVVGNSLLAIAAEVLRAIC